MRLAVFCEAHADFETATGLMDRLMIEDGPEWVREHVEFRPLDDLREWVGETLGIPFFNIHRVHQYADDRGILLPRYNFQGGHRGAGALAAVSAFFVARHEAKRSGPVDVVVFVWDMDDQGDLRREALEQARAYVSPSMIFGCPDLEREAWVLAGFDPESSAERERLHQERRRLRFSPCDEAHRLRDKSDHGERSPKRVLRVLTNDDRTREERCWTDAPLATLRTRGEQSGLRAFLDEVRERLRPLLSRPEAAR
jgi:hypothetical protein